jgi:hypothetical protein
VVVIMISSNGEMIILAKSGKYRYKGVSPYVANTIDQLARQKRFGQAWQILKRFDYEKL